MRRTLATFAIALVAVLALGACGGSPADEATPAATPAETATSPAVTDAPDGAALYADFCATCHAADGSGVKGPDIRGEDDLAGIAAQVTNGGGDMPAFAGQLAADEIQAVAAHVVGAL